MPGRDRTGPQGMGPGTGGGFGFCGTNRAPGYMGPRGRHFFGRGRCFSRGPGFAPFRPYAGYEPLNEQEEAEMMRQEARNLEAHLKTVKDRLAQLDERLKSDAQ